MPFFVGYYKTTVFIGIKNSNGFTDVFNSCNSFTDVFDSCNYYESSFNMFMSIKDIIKLDFNYSNKSIFSLEKLIIKNKQKKIENYYNNSNNICILKTNNNNTYLLSNSKKNLKNFKEWDNIIKNETLNT